MENTEELSQTLDASWKALRDSLGTPDFYIEIMIIAAAILLSYLLSLWLRNQVSTQLERHPPHRLDKSFIMQPLTLFTPLLAFFVLSVSKPFSLQYTGGDAFINAFMHLTLAYLAARLVMLVVRTKAVAYFIAGVILIFTVLDVTGFLVTTRAALESIAFDFGKFHLSMLGFVKGIICLVIVFWVASLLSHTLENYLQRSSRMSYNTRELIVKFFKITVYLLAFLVTLGAMGIDLTALAIFGGAMGVGVGLGLQKITANFVSGITLLMEKSIKIGDLIEVSNTMGWVRQLNIRYALVETFDGRELLIPNEMLISTQVTNWTYSTNRARLDLHVHITFDSNGQRAREIMLEAAKNHPRCLKDPQPACNLREFTEYGQHFLLTFWIPDIKEGRQAPQSEVLFTIAERFRAEKIMLLDRTKTAN